MCKVIVSPGDDVGDCESDCVVFQGWFFENAEGEVKREWAGC